MTIDSTMAQIPQDVTALTEAQPKSNIKYDVQIKEQILNIAKDSGGVKKDMILKAMINSIFAHLGGSDHPFKSWISVSHCELLLWFSH